MLHIFHSSSLTEDGMRNLRNWPHPKNVGNTRDVSLPDHKQMVDPISFTKELYFLGEKKWVPLCATGVKGKVINDCYNYFLGPHVYHYSSHMGWRTCRVNENKWADEATNKIVSIFCSINSSISLLGTHLKSILTKTSSTLHYHCTCPRRRPL